MIFFTLGKLKRKVGMGRQAVHLSHPPLVYTFSRITQAPHLSLPFALAESSSTPVSQSLLLSPLYFFEVTANGH